MRSKRVVRNQRNFRKTKSLRKRSVSKRNIRKTNRRLSKSRNLKKMRSKGGFKQSRKNQKRRITRKRGGASRAAILYSGVDEGVTVDVKVVEDIYNNEDIPNNKKKMETVLKECGFKTQEQIEDFVNRVTSDQIEGIFGNQLNCIVNDDGTFYLQDIRDDNSVIELDSEPKRNVTELVSDTTQGHRGVVQDPGAPPLPKKQDPEKLAWSVVPQEANPLYGDPDQGPHVDRASKPTNL